MKRSSLGKAYHRIKDYSIRKRMAADKNCLDHLSKILPRVSLEPTNVCSASCSFCGYKFLKRKKGVMGSDLFQALVDDIIQIGSSELKLTPIVGDPLCDRDILTKIEYASSKKRFSTISMTTNLINLNLFDLDRFVNSGVNEMTVSTCIANAEMFRKNFGVDAYEKVITNLKNLITANNKFGRPINISIALRNNKPARSTLRSPEFKELVAMGAKISFLWDEYDNWLGLIKIEDLPNGNSYRAVHSRTAPCSQLYAGFIIGYDGTINICRCRDLNMELSVGIYPDVSLREAWEGSRIKKYRENWQKGYLPQICRNCLQYTSAYEHPLLIDTYRSLSL